MIEGVDNFIAAIFCLTGVDDYYSVRYCRDYYEPLKDNNDLYAMHKILTSFNEKIDFIFRPQSIILSSDPEFRSCGIVSQYYFELVNDFANLMDKLSFEEFTDLSINKALSLFKALCDNYVSEHAIFYVIDYLTNCIKKGNNDCYEKDSFLFDISYYKKPRRYGVEELLKDIHDTVTYKENLYPNFAREEL